MPALKWQHEKSAWAQGYSFVAGLDEAGRGPWAGPVVAAAVILPSGCKVRGLNDSKKIPAEKRQVLAQQLRAHESVHWALGEASVEEIDTLNILQASLLAMRRALEALAQAADYLLVDGRDLPSKTVPGQAIIGGDGRSPSIAAASILAKEHRDERMRELARLHPEYSFDVHKGYGTALHQSLLKQYGVSPIHRRSFAPVRSALGAVL
jgi:ribonuclease HII